MMGGRHFVTLFAYVYLILCLFFEDAAAFFRLNEYHGRDYYATWKDIEKTIYDGETLQELIDLCPQGCATPSCNTFPVHRNPYTTYTTLQPYLNCSEDDIKALKQAKIIAKDWLVAVKNSKMTLLIRGITVGIIMILILILILRGHYRFRDLWFKTSDKQWQNELDPTWGLPGKVWCLLKMRVVKGKNKVPTDRKYQYYTENPTIMGDRFWYYKQALRHMYQSHTYYKRNRYFHKLAWQFTKLGMIVPETLRKHKKVMRRAGELEEAKSAEAEIEQQNRLPWEIDLADELNQVYLRKAKELLRRQIGRDRAEGSFVCGRYPAAHRRQAEILRQHHHHHHHKRGNLEPDFMVPLGREEVENVALEMEDNPNADYVMVDGTMRLHPNIKKHHHHHGKKTMKVPESSSKSK